MIIHIIWHLIELFGHAHPHLHHDELCGHAHPHLHHSHGILVSHRINTHPQP
jgi:hypothetical protein